MRNEQIDDRQRPSLDELCRNRPRLVIVSIVIMCDVSMLHEDMYLHLYREDWHWHDDDRATEVRQWIYWSTNDERSMMLTWTIWTCCRPTARCKAVWRLVFWILIEALPLLRRSSATRQWSFNAARCKAVNPSSFFSSTNHCRLEIFDRINSIALEYQSIGHCLFSDWHFVSFD